ncbi:MAG TPA: HAMP domain-containing sensor histidine kinase [Chryseosolibacter sp.]|nr:HAMP domain-containing sensor histidine kinase [Chryseosolibacter sp.]
MVGIFSFLNPSEHLTDKYKGLVYVTNVMSFIFCLVTLGVNAYYYYFFGWLPVLYFIFVMALLFLIIPGINRINHRVGRTMFCLIPIWLTMFVTIYFKLKDFPQTYITYFDSRFILMATLIVPGIVFRLQERMLLYICLASSTVTIILYDVIHEFFGAGYYQKGFNDPSYYYINYIVSLTFVVQVFGILVMRSVMGRTAVNLENQNREIEAQHEELLQHQEEMVSSSEKLEAAYALITKQQAALEKHNASLEALVAEKSQELLHTNQELTKYNNELLQFSYTVSHNLRGPVARLLGLTRLFKVTEGLSERVELEERVLKSSQELDDILKDISLIIDIRNEIYRVRERVYFEDEFNKALSLLDENIKAEHSFSKDFSEAPYVFGVRPMVQSIIYNLLSNAIKYQSPDRPLRVRIRSYAPSPMKTILEVSDNGMGIDLVNQQDNIFKLYKRFHSHVGGKGLGLYLVKIQVEALGGEIEVDSQVDQGATFRVIFKQPEEVDRQVFHDTEIAKVYYNAKLKICVIQWQRPVTSAEYRETLGTVLDSLKHHNTPGLISDVRKRGAVSREDQQWLFNTFEPKAISNGLRQVAVVGINNEELSLRQRSALNLQGFDSMEQAEQWMKETLWLSEVSGPRHDLS